MLKRRRPAANAWDRERVRDTQDGLPDAVGGRNRGDKIHLAPVFEEEVVEERADRWNPP